MYYDSTFILNKDFKIWLEYYGSEVGPILTLGLNYLDQVFRWQIQNNVNGY